MSLLNVTVKRAKYIGPQAAQFNTYVTLKIQNVKSTTVTVKGSDPCWEQDFLFETNSVNSGLLVEVWTKGMIWDRALGYQLIPLNTIPYSTENSQGQWYPLDMDVILTDGEVAGTKNPTGHLILIDCHFELPFDPETEPGDLQRKLEMLNGMMTHDRKQRQAQYLGNSGYSEDSDYTSDLNYPVGQNANSSASQYRNLRTPQRSLETSRENSYEKDDRSFYYECYSDNKQNMMSYSPTDYYCKDENDPLSYNSRPMNTVNYNKSIYGQSASVFRKRSLERQDTLYDEYGDTYSNKTVYQNTEDQYGFYDTNSDNLSEDRQWDSGGRGTSMNKILPKIPIKHSSSMVDSIYHRGASLPPTPPVAHKKTRLLPQPGSGSGGQGGGSGKSLPATPRLLPQPKAAKKLSTTPTTTATTTKRYSDNELADFDSYSTTSQQSNISKNSPSALTSSYNIRPHTSVSAINYNEDYNYAYNSTDSLNQTFSDVIARRKGAALPTIPGLNTSSKTPKIGQNANSNYTSQSFEYEKSFADRDYYASSTTTDDYFYDNDVTNAALANSLTSSVSRKSKKLPTPSSSSMSSAFSTPTLGTSGLRSGSKLPQIPPTSAQSTIGGKILPSTPMQSNYDDDLYYTTSFPKNSYDDYATSTITTCTAPTFSTNISNFNYESYTNSSYDTVLTPTAAPTTVTTKSTTTMGGYYKPPSISSSIGMTTTEQHHQQQQQQQTKPTTSVLGSLTTGFKATVGGVVGGVGSSVGVGSLGGGSGSSSTTSSGSSATASLTSTAKSYLGLASKFLPNLTGNTTTAVSTIASAGQNATTITPSVSTYGLNRNIPSNTTTTTITDKYNNITEYNNTNRFEDSSNSYYTNSMLTKTSNTPIVSNNSMIYTGSTNLTGTITTPTTLTQDKNNYNTYYNDNSLDNYNTSNLQYSNQTYLENNDDYQQYDNDNIDSYNLYASTTSTTMGVSDINDMTPQTTATSLLISSAPTTLSSATTTTSSAITTSTRIGNIVDYSDDYKFGYDEYSYSENDYIATGDITDKQNYNNNYDIYDIASSSTGVDTSTTITTSSTLTSTSLYDYDYNSSYLNNKNSIYCDNSSNLITLTTTVTASTIPSTTTTGAASAALSGNTIGQTSLNKLGGGGGNQNNLILDKKSSSITSTTSTANNYMNNIYSSSIPASTTTTNSYYMDQKSTPPTCSDVTTPTSASLTSTASTGKKLPAINGKSGVLMKQQTEIFDEDDIAASDVEQDMENDQDSYYNIDQGHHQITTATSGITTTSTTSNEYYDNTYGASDTPYYDYREDYFNEEDEYKYLEKEQQQNQLLQHQKQPPLEFIEESHDDYIDDDNVTDHSIDNAYLDSTQSLNKQQQQQQQMDDNKMKHHQLPTQETIDESSNDYMFLQKQDSIIEEEDAEPIPSPTDIYEKKDPTKSSQLQNQISCDILIPEEEPKKKTPTITRGETEEVTSGQMVRKTEVTARQRWHWAYNKIIMQLNVSNR